MTEEQKRVCFVDTDIKDIGEKYKPLEYMALADALAPGEKPVSTQILRTGPGRNNEMWIAAANALGVEGVNAMHIAALLEHGQLDEETQSWVAEEYDRISRSPESATRKIELSRLLSRIGWPLTGERSIDGTFLTNMHFSTGMGIETAIDVAVAGYEVATRELQLTQVCDPNQKIENGESLTDREQNLINLCTRFQKALTSHIDRTGKLPHEWSLQDVKRFNLLHAKLTMAQTTASLQEHTAQTTSLVEQEFLLPTVEQLVEIGAVDLEAIKEYFYQNNRHFQN
jgi:hypothetical protein